METGLKVGDVMTRTIVFVSPETNLYECARAMIKKRVGCLIIIDKEKLKGILSKKDIIWALVKKSKKDLKNILARDIMIKKVVQIKPSADIIDAVKIFKKKKIKRIPVLENGKIIGVISMKDIMRLDPGLIEMIAESTKIKEEAEKLRRNDFVSSRADGICERCGNYDILINEGAQSICIDCLDEKP